MPTLPLRLALVGCGQIARLHATRIERDPRVELAAVFDPQLPSAEALRNEFAPQASLCRTFDELLTQTNIDGAIICTPTGLHFEQTRACRANGWAVLCEKPLAETAEKIQQLIAESQTGPLLAVAYQRRHAAVFRTLRREVLSGRWGRVLSLGSHNSEHWEQSQALPNTWRNDPRQNPGGYIGDAGSHKIDTVCYVTGLQPVEVFAYSSKSQRQVEIVTTLTARMEGDVLLGMSFLGNAHHFTELLHVVCEEADFKLLDTQLYRSCRNELVQITDLEPESNPVSGFIDTLTGAAENLAPAACAWPVFRMTQAVLESARTGQPVRCA